MARRVQTTYLPQLADHYRARRIAQPLLTQKRSDGTLHLAPPVAGRARDRVLQREEFLLRRPLPRDAETGRVKRRLVKSTLNSNYESLRFINSGRLVLADGRYFAIAAKRRDRDDLVILDVKKDEEVRRIRVPLNGLTTPSWSPDGKQLVFTGYDGGLSDLFVVNADGTNLHRLTNDKYADLEPSWSPDGKTIAFVTDRSPATDFEALKFGNLRIALFHLDKGSIDILRNMDQGKTSIPPGPRTAGRWRSSPTATGSATSSCTTCPTGRSTSSPTCLRESRAITALSPCLSWAHEADRLAFAYYEDGEYNVYAVDNPRSLKRQPYQAPATPPITSLLAAQRRALAGPAPVAVAATATADTQPRAGTSVYRSSTGFRASGSAPQTPDSGAGPAPVSVKSLIDSSPALPDTERVHVQGLPHPVQPGLRGAAHHRLRTDNFGRGFFGGTAISLSGHPRQPHDGVLGLGERSPERGSGPRRLHQPGAPPELGVRRLAAAAVLLPAHGRGQQRRRHVYRHRPRIERFVIRDVFAQSFYPFSRFTRVEMGAHFSNISQAVLRQDYLVDGFGQVIGVADPVTRTALP